MILPQSYPATLLLLLLSLFCLGSWVNTYKIAASKWRYELYYVDWAVGALLAVVVLAFTAGSLGFDGFSFTDDLSIAAKKAWAYAGLAGVIFNLGNLLVMAAISMAGMAAALSIALGVAIFVAAIVSFAMHPSGPLPLLLLSCAFLVAAVVSAALVHRQLTILRHEAVAKAGQAKSTRRPGSGKVIILATTGGLLLGSFFPLLDSARAGEIGMGPYALGFLFVLGAGISTFLFDLFFMNLPVEGEPLEVPEYFRGALKHHLLGAAGGVLWCVGLVAGFVVAAAPAAVSRPLHDVLTLAAPLVAALWGILLWKEFRGGDSHTRVLTWLMLMLFAAGIGVLSVTPLYAVH
jgi:glucose uptake protein